MGRKINLKELLSAKQKSYRFAQESPSVVLTYRAEVKLEDETEPRKIE